LRFTLAALAAQGRDIRLSEKIIEGYRHFANKVWNIARFVLNALEGVNLEGEKFYKPEDRWILTKLSETIETVDRELAAYRFNDAAKAIYQFLWNEFADWYIEFSKQRLYKGTEEEKRTAAYVLATVLRDALKVLHPIMPFLTEEIYQKLPNKDAESIVIAPWPCATCWNFPEDAKLVEVVKEIVRGIRNAKAELNIPPSTRVPVFVRVKEEALRGVLESMEESIKQLARVSKIEIVAEKPSNSVAFFLPEAEVYVQVADVIDVEKEIDRISKKLKSLEKDISKLEKKLSNENFLKKAPADVVEKAKSELAELKEVYDRFTETLKQLKELV
jgi:valyl-tRNA synthetase